MQHTVDRCLVKGLHHHISKECGLSLSANLEQTKALMALLLGGDD